MWAPRNSRDPSSQRTENRPALSGTADERGFFTSSEYERRGPVAPEKFFASKESHSGAQFHSEHSRRRLLQNGGKLYKHPP
jgi:hypothetical protein